MSRGNQRVTLPQIQRQHQQQLQQENYNFITSNKKRPIPQQEKDESFEIDWKRKCDELSRDIEIRNQSIFSLQRNFESLSTLLKNEKSENSAVREEVQRLREFQTQFSQKEKDYQNKISELTRNLKESQAQVEAYFEDRKANNKLINEINVYKSKINELETIIQKKIEELQQEIYKSTRLQQEVYKLQKQESLNQEFQLQIQQLQDKIIQLEKQLEEKEINLQLSFKNSQQLTQLIEQLKKDAQTVQFQIKCYKANEQKFATQLDKQQSQLQQYEKKVQQQKDQLDGQQTLLMTKNQIDGQQTQQLKQLQQQYIEQQQLFKEEHEQLEQLKSFLNDNQHIIDQYKQIITSYGQFDPLKLIEESENLQKSLRISQDKCQLYQKELLDSQGQNQQQINELTILKNKVQIQTKENEQLITKLTNQQKELNLYKSNSNNEKIVTELSQQLKDGFEEINKQKIINQQLQNKLDEFDQYSQLISDYKNIGKNALILDGSEIQALKQNLQQFKESNDLMIEEIKQKDQKIINLQLVNEQVEEYKKNLNSTTNELSNLKSELQEMNILNISLSKENKQAIKQIESFQQQIQNSNRENRNLQQELQENQEKLFQAQQRLSSQQKEMKASLEQAQQLNIEIKELTNRLQQTEQDLQLLNPEKLRNLQKELESKEKEFQSQLMNISHAQNAELPSISCQGCMNVIKKAITCYPCGHSYCDSCFQNQCTECTNYQGQFKNKQLDDLISKINYSIEILNTYKK